VERERKRLLTLGLYMLPAGIATWFRCFIFLEWCFFIVPPPPEPEGDTAPAAFAAGLVAEPIVEASLFCAKAGTAASIVVADKTIANLFMSTPVSLTSATFVQLHKRQYVTCGRDKSTYCTLADPSGRFLMSFYISDANRDSMSKIL
jgi:hypothetical protein